MVFNSIPFILFFVVFYFLYRFVFNRSLKLQNLLLLAGSYFFYAWFDWRFLFLIVFSSAITYYIAIAMRNAAKPQNKKRLFNLGLIIVIGI